MSATGGSVGRVLGLVLAAAVALVAFALFLAVAVALLAVALAVGLAWYVRSRWRLRKASRQARGRTPARPGAIEAEFRVKP